MVTSSIYLTHQTPLFHRYLGFSRKVASHFGQQFQITANHSEIPVSSGRASCLFHSYPVNFGHGIGFKDLRSSKLRFRQMDTRRIRVPAAGDGGSAGGYGGGPGDGDSGDGNENDGDGENWSFLSWYLALLAKYPVLTKAVTGALLTFIGDLICQLVIDQLPSLDLKRIFMFTLLGLVLVGPTLHVWYLYLSKLVTLPGASGALLRLVLDQFVFSPIFIGVFLSSLVTLEGRPSQVVPKLQQEWFSAVTANWQLWIPFQFLNFRFVPQQFQVLAANVIALVWNVILSFKAHKEVLQK